MTRGCDLQSEYLPAGPPGWAGLEVGGAAGTGPVVVARADGQVVGLSVADFGRLIESGRADGYSCGDLAALLERAGTELANRRVRRSLGGLPAGAAGAARLGRPAAACRPTGPTGSATPRRSSSARYRRRAAALLDRLRPTG